MSTSFAFGRDWLIFRVNPEAVLVNQDTEVSFTFSSSRIMKDPVVKLLHVVDLSHDEVVAHMHDDGKEGDEKADDGNFTAVLSLHPKEARPITYKVVVETHQQSATVVSKEVNVEVIECPQ